MTHSVATLPVAFAVDCASEAHTQQLGASLGRQILPLLAARDRAFVLALAGPLGAGKTTLARGLLAQLGVTGVVRSPSYSLMECYERPDCLAVHVDLYRLAGREQIAQLGLRDFDRGESLWLIEWPERAGPVFAQADLTLQLSIGATQHRVTLTAGTGDGRRVIEALVGAA